VDYSPPLIYITNLQVSWVHPKSVQNLLFHKFVLFKHECHALFKHGSHVHDFCVQTTKIDIQPPMSKKYEQTYDIRV
jgi:hypothetical protein